MRYSHLLWCLLLLAAASCRKALPINGARCTAGEANCVCDTQSGECFITGVNNPGGAGCTPLTCDAIKATCGEFADSCTKKTLECGSCDTGQVCQYQRDASNKPSSSACIVGTQTTCQSLGYNCGTYTDPITNQLHDCTKEVNSGQPCASGTSCGGGGQANVCGCTPLTCSDLHRVCGDHDGDGQPLQDGCGSFLNCDVQAGGCPPGEVCNFTSGTCEATNCTSFTCDQLGNPCGQVNDGCGALISCSAGVCAAGSMCDPTSHKCLSLTLQPNGQPVANPNDPIDSVACEGRTCGLALDACGVDHTCASSVCGGGDQCIGNQCIAPPSAAGEACPPGRCGPSVLDAFGRAITSCNPTPTGGLTRQQMWNGLCPGGQLCEPNTGFCMDPGSTTCIAQGKNCGNIWWVDAGGSHKIDCYANAPTDTCPTEPGFSDTGDPALYTEVCGGSGVPGVCALPHAPVTCIEQNVHCGEAEDSCGNEYICGACQAGNKCQFVPASGTNPLVTQCQACAQPPTGVENGGDYYDCQSPQYNFMCGTNLDNHCAGTTNCGCPAINNTPDAANDGNCQWGPCYTQSSGTVACSTNTAGQLGTCQCTPNKTCANQNACNTTIADDGCNHPLVCGACSNITADPNTVCQDQSGAQQNFTCCDPDTNKNAACAATCGDTNDCNAEVIVGCEPGTDANGTADACAPSNTAPIKVCGQACNNHPERCERPQSDSCCPAGPYSPISDSCCAAGFELSGCAGGPSATCQTGTAKSCCQPWTCAQFLAANPTDANKFFAANKISDGCGGTIGNACTFCGASTGDGTNNENWVANGSGNACICPTPTAAQCTAAGDCTGQVLTETCAAVPASSTPQVTNTFTCNVANVCGAGFACVAGACCADNCGNNCNDTICAGAFACGNCATGTCLGNFQCCASGVNVGNTCCGAGQVAAGGVCCASTQGTVGGLKCCPGGQVPIGSGGTASCCTPATCGSLGDDGSVGKACAAIPDSCGGTLTCNCDAGESCTSNVCVCSNPVVVCGGTDCGTFNAGQCNSKDCGTCPGTEVCQSNTCSACTLPTCPAGKCTGSVNNSCGTVNCTAANCGGDVCNATTGQCCSALNDVVVSGVCCPSSQVSGSTCCVSGDVTPTNAPGDGACCPSATPYYDGSTCCSETNWSGTACVCTASPRPTSCDGSNGPTCDVNHLTGCCCGSGGEYSDGCGDFLPCNSGSSGGQ